MKVETIDGGNLRVWLSREETDKWGLDSPANARRLVRRALHMAHVRPDTAVLAEVFPVEGGCVLLLSPRRAFATEAVEPTVYRVDSADALCCLAEGWCHLPQERGGGPGVQIYEREEGYDIAVCPVETLSAARCCLLTEYGYLTGAGQGALAAAEEYGHYLGDDRVLHILGVTAPVPPPPTPGERRH